jgi:hypothetical protein
MNTKTARIGWTDTGRGIGIANLMSIFRSDNENIHNNGLL